MVSGVFSQPRVESAGKTTSGCGESVQFDATQSGEPESPDCIGVPPDPVWELLTPREQERVSLWNLASRRAGSVSDRSESQSANALRSLTSRFQVWVVFGFGCLP